MSKTNNNKAAMSVQESWASNISDYMLLRRRQTYEAYSVSSDRVAASSDTSHQQDAQTQNSSLFSALFIMLAAHLEEGHTVLTIAEAEQEKPLQGSTNGETATLYAWQQRLLERLAAPMLALLDTQVGIQPPEERVNELSIFDSLDTLFAKQAQLWTQLAVSNYEKEMLHKRFAAVTKIYHILKNTDLNAFIKRINEDDLFTNLNSYESYHDNKNSLSNINKFNQPIIYQQVKKDNHISLTLWLHRAWQAEFSLAKNINNILNQQITPLPIGIPEGLHKNQVTAIDVANNNAFSIITGGPGTGKTYTVAQLVIALQQATQSRGEEHDNIRFSTDSASLALAAPTGKAAQRMQESLQAALDSSKVKLQLQEAKTIHRLLGIGRTGRPRYDATNPLGEDIIIIDEASMLGVELANYLVSAIKPGARLILLGDANQLAAVDAGAVLADLCRIPILQPIHAELTESRRFGADSGIGQLAAQINKAETDTQAIWQLLKTDEALSFQRVNALPADILLANKIENSLSNLIILKEISDNYQNYIIKVEELLLDPIEKSMPKPVKATIASLTAVFNQFRILTAVHKGEWGDQYINNYLTQWHLTELKLPLGQNTWFHGRPVMILQNNYELGLFNGDIGFCLQIGEDSGQLEVFFENKEQGIAVNLLNEEVIATAYAMTIHKSQGSEFDHVATTFDNSQARLLSKELIYTAVTRAKKQVTIYSTKQAFEKAVQTPTERYTGLAQQFSNLKDS
ncbi:exodeoxyribonuclease V subunit alpha [Psychrobacter sp. AH5]|uniref:exodeoxyribonuclease V subunit alpha n=1 Tax=Psychrobacter sp. AH5 TaxID=2937433 RepID=UPI00333E926A